MLWFTLLVSQSCVAAFFCNYVNKNVWFYSSFRWMHDDRIAIAWLNQLTVLIWKSYSCKDAASLNFLPSSTCCLFSASVFYVFSVKCIPRSSFTAMHSHVFSKEAMCFLLDKIHVVSLPGSGGSQHVFPPQHQNSQALMLKLWHHRQQLKNTHRFYIVFIFYSPTLTFRSRTHTYTDTLL